MKKYYLSFKFCDTEGDAQTMINSYNAYATRWQKKRYPGHVTEWKSEDGMEHKWIAWYSSI